VQKIGERANGSHTHACKWGLPYFFEKVSRLSRSRSWSRYVRDQVSYIWVCVIGGNLRPRDFVFFIRTLPLISVPPTLESLASPRTVQKVWFYHSLVRRQENGGYILQFSMPSENNIGRQELKINSGRELFGVCTEREKVLLIGCGAKKSRRCWAS